MTSTIDLNLALRQLNLKSSTYNPPLDRFYLFSSLAPELRLKIWSFACFPRVVPVQYHSTTKTVVRPGHRNSRIQKTFSKFTSNAAPPAILSVCAESRAQALKTYSLTFATPTAPATIYFSPIHDTLYFPRYREMGYDETARDFRTLVSRRPPQNKWLSNHQQFEEQSEEVSVAFWDEVRSIALDYVDINIKRPWESYNKATLIRSFPNLNEICLVVAKPTENIAPINPLKNAANQCQRSDVEVVFRTPRIAPESLLRWWVGFRQSFIMEERMLEDMTMSSGGEYDKFTLPLIKMVEMTA